MSDLQKMFKERTSRPVIRERDFYYHRLHNIYMGRKTKGQSVEPSLEYAPLLIDDFEPATDGDSRQINHVRRIVAYQAALYARPPALFTRDVALQATLDQVKECSHILQQQPRISHWLALRGDACVVTDYDTREDCERVFWRTFDPWWCYPTFLADDPAGLADLLVTFELPKKQVQSTYGVDSGKDMQRVFFYWDEKEFRLEVDGIDVKKFWRTHDLGFCPARWCFASGDPNMGQADIRDITDLQKLHSDVMELTVDSIRKKVDPAYYGVGIKGDVTPKPGHVTAFPNPDAKIAEYPLGVDPQVLIGANESIESHINALAGMSSISARGQAPGSIVTGSAVRNQVEAIQARGETRKGNLESMYMELGAQALRCFEKHFPDKSLIDDGPTGSEVQKRTRCTASYGGLFGLDVMNRVRAANELLGRFIDEEYGITLMDLPGVEPAVMVERLRAYQKRQAETTALSQQAAQEIAGQQQQPGGIPAMPPPGKRTQPTFNQVQQTFSRGR